MRRAAMPGLLPPAFRCAGPEDEMTRERALQALSGGAFPCRLRAFSFKCENRFERDVQRQAFKNEAEGQVLPDREEYPEASG